MITQKHLKEILSYNRTTGIFIWKIFKVGCVRNIAGCLTKDGYRTIGIENRLYYAHRLAWLYVYGVWPKRLDHKDTNKDHNWIKNLREITRSGNAQNLIKAHKDSKTGVLGVSLIKKSGKYKMQLWIKNKRIQSNHDTLEEAQEARLTA